MFMIALVVEDKINFHDCRYPMPYDLMSSKYNYYHTVTQSGIPCCRSLLHDSCRTGGCWLEETNEQGNTHPPPPPHTHTHYHSLTHTPDAPCRLIPANYIEVVPASRSSSQQQQSIEDSGGAAAAASAVSGSQTPPQQSHQRSSALLQRQLLRNEKED